MDAISSTGLVALFDAWSATFNERRDFLISLDGKVGDSDLGITMSKAFAAAAETVGALAVDTPLSQILIKAGTAMAKAAPSTMGTLTATGFMRGGKALDGAGILGLKEAAAFWRAYGNGIAERGKAKVGDKTILDVIDPVASALEHAAVRGVSLGDALSQAASAAADALEKTKTMLAQHGKAAAFQEKSVGLQDAGATVGVFLIQTMRDFVVSGPGAAASQDEGRALPSAGDRAFPSSSKRSALRQSFKTAFQGFFTAGHRTLGMGVLESLANMNPSPVKFWRTVNRVVRQEATVMSRTTMELGEPR